MGGPNAEVKVFSGLLVDYGSVFLDVCACVCVYVWVLYVDSAGRCCRGRGFGSRGGEGGVFRHLPAYLICCIYVCMYMYICIYMCVYVCICMCMCIYDESGVRVSAGRCFPAAGFGLATSTAPPGTVYV